MKTKGLIVIALVAIFTLNSTAQEGQNRFGFEFNGGASFATRDLGGASLNTGFGFEGIFHYRFLPHTGVYAGWGWNSFGSDNSFAGEKANFDETGYVFGLQYKHPIGDSPVSYYLRGGGLYNHIEVENKDGEIIKDSGHGLGWQAAAGIDVPLGANWNLVPGVNFHSLSREIDNEGTSTSLTLNYISVRVGIIKKF